MKWALIALALVSADCRRTFVLVTIGSGSPAPPGVHSINLELALGGRTATNSLREPGGGAISLPTTAAIEITGGGDRISADATGFSASSTAVAWGSGSTEVRSGSETPLALTLSTTLPPPRPDGGTGGADGGSTPVDLRGPGMCAPPTTNRSCTGCTFSEASQGLGGCGAGSCAFTVSDAGACVNCLTGRCDLTCGASCTFHCAAGATCTLRCSGGSPQPITGSGGC